MRPTGSWILRKTRWKPMLRDENYTGLRRRTRRCLFSPGVPGSTDLTSVPAAGIQQLSGRRDGVLSTKSWVTGAEARARIRPIDKFRH